LLSRPLDEVVKEFVFKGDPYVFLDRPQAFDKLKSRLCASLGLSESNVLIIGSAKMGFSLSPDSFPRPFLTTSDIDVLIVDEQLYDRCWLAILKWHYSRHRASLELGAAESQWIGKRMKSVYWGWLQYDDLRTQGLGSILLLKSVRDLSSAWFEAFKSLTDDPDFAKREVTGRLYRTWDHALLYHVDGLELIKRRISGYPTRLGK
jgi:hypothetical protein